MLAQFFSIGLLMLFSAMLPGPDFALVTKNTLLHSRQTGFFTVFGISAAVLIHITYCSLGLALVIANSLLLFSIIKYLGAAYLLYLGMNSLFSKQPKSILPTQHKIKRKISHIVAFRQGFFCNLLNPKATLFFLALFTLVIKSQTPSYWLLIYAIEMLLLVVAWFSLLVVILSHPRVTRLLEKAEKYIAKLLGIFLCGFGIALIFVKK